MRKLSFALAGLLLLSATPSFAWMPGDNPYDPGCNVNQGGNCGRQLDSWNHTWRRMGLPREPGRGAYGTYLPGGGFAPDGFGGFAGGGYGGAYGGGYGGAYGGGYGGGQAYQGPAARGYMTRTIAQRWSGHRLPNGMFVCDSGPCPQNGIYGN